MSDPGVSCLDSPCKRAHCLAEDWEAGSFSRVPPQLLSWGHGLLQAARSPRLGKRWWYWWYQDEPGYFPNRRSLLPSGGWGDFVSPEPCSSGSPPHPILFLLLFLHSCNSPIYILHSVSTSASRRPHATHTHIPHLPDPVFCWLTLRVPPVLLLQVVLDANLCTPVFPCRCQSIWRANSQRSVAAQFKFCV